MFIEMKKQRTEFSFGSAKMWLRYDIQAMYNIEDSGFDPFDILSQYSDPKAVRCFLRYGLSDWFGSSPDDNSLDDYVNRLMCAGDFQIELLALIQSAVILALPQKRIGNHRNRENKPAGNILPLMSAFIDIMGASENEFLSSTLREATERWERYSTAMGYSKPTEKFSRFDDDD